ANAGKPDSFAVNISGRIDVRAGKTTDDTLFARILVHKNNQIGQQQEFYNGQIGYHTQFTTQPGEHSQNRDDAEAYKHALYFPLDLSLGYTQNAVFPTGSATDCAADPTAPKCIT